MIEDQKFNCPACGAPGETINGQALYSCMCRHAWVFKAAAFPLHAQPLCSCPPGTVCLNVACPHRAQVTCEAGVAPVGFDTIIDSDGGIHGAVPLTFRRDLGGHYE